MDIQAYGEIANRTRILQIITQDEYLSTLFQGSDILDVEVELKRFYEMNSGIEYVFPELKSDQKIEVYTT